MSRHCLSIASLAVALLVGGCTSETKDKARTAVEETKEAATAAGDAAVSAGKDVVEGAKEAVHEGAERVQDATSDSTEK
jgi:hypothetical protein